MKNLIILIVLGLAVCALVLFTHKAACTFGTRPYPGLCIPTKLVFESGDADYFGVITIQNSIPISVRKLLLRNNNGTTDLSIREEVFRKGDLAFITLSDPDARFYIVSVGTFQSLVMYQTKSTFPGYSGHAPHGALFLADNKVIAKYAQQEVLRSIGGLLKSATEAPPAATPKPVIRDSFVFEPRKA